MKFLKTALWLGATWVSFFLFDWFYEKYYFKKKYLKLLKELKIDTAKENLFLLFGVNDQPCPNIQGEAVCLNLDCNDGRINYILNLIKNAKKSLDVCIYIITAQMIGSCILEAHSRGVKVRLIVDADMACSSQSAVHKLRYSGVPVRQRFSPYIMHHKFIIIDEEILVNGSMNFTMTGIYCNWETVMITSQPQVVLPFRDLFTNLWDDFKPAQITPNKCSNNEPV